jgi:X-X-X-Leu-X-X-Gly heptad repeat protein
MRYHEAMPTRAATVRMLVAILALTTAGCGSSADKTTAAPGPGAATGGTQSHAAAQVAAGAQQVAEGARQMARGVQQLAQAAATPIAFETLETLLPDVDGWKKMNPSGEMISLPVSYTNAKARYTRDTSTIELEITDTALSQVLLGPATMFMSTGFEEKSDDGYKKALTIRGAPAYEDWNKPAKTADLTVIVAARFVVHGKGRDVTSVDPVRAVVQAVDFQKLAKLK